MLQCSNAHLHWLIYRKHDAVMVRLLLLALQRFVETGSLPRNQIWDGRQDLSAVRIFAPNQRGPTAKIRRADSMPPPPVPPVAPTLFF
jgi:hypothetical protein